MRAHVERLAPVAGFVQREAGEIEVEAQEFANRDLVLDDQHGRGGVGPGCRILAWAWNKRSRLLKEEAGSEPDGEDDFEKLFEASAQARRIEKGRTIEGTVVAIGEESALVDVGGKSEAEIDIDELKDEDVIWTSPSAIVSRRPWCRRRRSETVPQTGARRRHRTPAQGRLPRRPSCRGQG